MKKHSPLHSSVSLMPHLFCNLFVSFINLHLWACLLVPSLLGTRQTIISIGLEWFLNMHVFVVKKQRIIFTCLFLRSRLSLTYALKLKIKTAHQWGNQSGRTEECRHLCGLHALKNNSSRISFIVGYLIFFLFSGLVCHLLLVEVFSWFKDVASCRENLKYNQKIRSNYINLRFTLLAPHSCTI